MEVLGPAQAAPTTEEIIAKCGPALADIMRTELDDAISGSDRVWLLRTFYRNFLYYHNLQNFAPSFFQSLLDVTSVNGPQLGGYNDQSGEGLYDYSQNLYRGYCRKLEAILGNRMPNVEAVPNDPNDEDAIRAVDSANAAALFIREKCDMQKKALYQVMGHFNAGTIFWHFDMVEDGQKYGYDMQPGPPITQQHQVGAGFTCPGCGSFYPTDPNDPMPPPTCTSCGTPIGPQNFQPPHTIETQIPGEPIPVPRKGIEIDLHAVDEIAVPLDCTGIDDPECKWLRWSREQHKSGLLANKKWGPRLRDESNNAVEDSSGEYYAESIRSALSSPIGLIRAKRENYWTRNDTWWRPELTELIDDDSIRGMMQQNFPNGFVVTSVRGVIVDIQQSVLADHWHECQPEPTQRIMGDALGNDWTQVQDLADEFLNQCTETLGRANLPILVDAMRWDVDAWEITKSTPVSMFPMLRPAGMSLQDTIFQPQQPQFSEQIPAMRAQIENQAQNDNGLTPSIWGGEGDEPTARQAELKKNAALQQLGVEWSMIGKALEKVNKKCCNLLAQDVQGIMMIAKPNQFGGFDQMSIVAEDLKSDLYHFEADEAIPMTWGQQRDLLMWMLDKPAPLLEMWGFTDPLNIPEFKRLMGMPGMRVPKYDDRAAAMATIQKLLADKPIPGQPGDPNDPNAQVGPPQPSIQPQWEEDAAFCAQLAKVYLVVKNKNGLLEQNNPDGVDNLRLWGQAQDAKANPPAAPPPPKVNITASVKGDDIGDAATQQLLTKSGLIDQGTPVESFQQKQEGFRQSQGLPPQPVPEFQPGPMSPPLPPPSLAGQSNVIPTPANLPPSLQ